ncbi:MAG: hypothetical protein RAP41_07925 [Candidatus Orphnella occulta]|nr:hypothetical protein [Candidatus Orphnella occulta]
MNNEELKVGCKRRSAGVVAFALSIIIISIFRLLGTGSISVSFSQLLPRAALVLIIIYSLLSNIGFITGAVNIFRLKNWARKLVLLLTAMQLLYMLVIAIPLSNRSVEAMKTAPGAQERIWAGYEVIPENLRLDNDVTEEEYSELVFKMMYQTALVVKIISIFYLLLTLFFFTRRRVKEQFLFSRVAPTETGK